MPDSVKQSGILDVPVDGGLDTKTDPRRVQPPKTTTAQDVFHVSPGQVRKREGVATAAAPACTTTVAAGVGFTGTTTSAATVGYNLGTYSRPGRATAELIAHQTLASGPPILAADSGLRYTAPAFAHRVRLQSQTTGGTQSQSTVSVDSTTGLALVAWINTSTTLNYIIYDTATGALVYPSAFAPGVGTNITAFAVACAPGSGWGFVYADGATLGGFFQPAPGVSTVSGSLGGFVGNLDTTKSVDICWHAAQSKWYVIAATDQSTHGVELIKTNLAMDDFAASTLINSNVTDPYVVAAAANDTYAVTARHRYNAAATVTTSWLVYNSVGTASATQTVSWTLGRLLQLAVGFAGNGSTCNVVFYTTQRTPITGGTGYPANYTVVQVLPAKATISGSIASISAATLGTNRAFTSQYYSSTAVEVALLSKPFMSAGQPVCALAYTVNSSAYVFGLDFDGNVAFRVSPNNAESPLYIATNGLPRNPGPATAYNSATYFAFGQLLATQAGTQTGTQVAVVETPAVQPPMQQLGPGLHVAAQPPSFFDGLQTSESDFHFAAGLPSSTAVLTGGAFLAAGTYLYKHVWEWIDGNGVLHQSTPSAAITVVADGAHNYTIAMPCYGPTTRPSVVTSALYRTTAGGTTYYRVTGVAQGALQVGASDAAAFNLYTDTGANTDAIISAKARLYTSDGTYDFHPPYQFTATVQYGGRLFGIIAEDPTKVMYSSVYSPGSPLTWNRSNYLSLPAESGGAVGLTVIDGNLFIGAKDRWYTTFGQGPQLTEAAGTNFSPVTQLATTTGISVPESLVSISTGAIFQSRQGFMLIDRAGTAQFLGAPVEQYTQLYSYGRPFVYPEYNSIVWMAQGQADGVASTLCFNYEQNKWAVWTNPQGVALVSTSPTTHYTQKTTGGIQRVLVPSTWTDAGAYYNGIIETPWITTGALMGSGVVWEMQVLGEYKSAHTLQVEIATNYGTYRPAQTIATSAGLTGSDTVYQFRFRIPVPNAYAVRFRLQDTTQSGTGESCRISGLMVYMGVDDGLSRLPAVKSR
jgi:hypothetical protein